MIKKLFKLFVTGIEKALYAAGIACFGIVAYGCFTDIAATTGWAVLGYFFLGLVCSILGLSMIFILGLPASIIFNGKKKAKKEKEIDYSEYEMYLNG